MSLPTLLSQVFVAWTIEVDNEVERQMPHRSALHVAPPDVPDAPRLVSVAMYWTCLRHVDGGGTTLGELTARTRTETNLNGMIRWGYVTVDGAPPRRPVRPRADLTIRPTAAGRRARQEWERGLASVDRRWRDRFGSVVVDELMSSLAAIDAELDPALPDCLPILGHAQTTAGLVRPSGPGAIDRHDPRLPILLARVLLAFAIEVDEASRVPMAIGSNLLRVLDPAGIAVRDLPALTGVSREAIAMSTGVIGERELVAEGPAPSGARGRVVRLTPAGVAARSGFDATVSGTEDRWRRSHGTDAIDGLRARLGALVEPLDSVAAPIRQGLSPSPNGWRASAPAKVVLPQFPMVLLRGGWPDGA